MERINDVTIWGETAVSAGNQGTPTKKQVLYEAVNAVFEHYDFIYIERTGDYYYRRRGTEDVFEVANSHRMDALTVEVVGQTMGFASAGELREVTETWKQWVGHELSDIPMEVIKVADKLYWDRDKGELESEANTPCFYELFNREHATKHAAVVPPFTEAQVSQLRENYETYLSRFEEVGPRGMQRDFVRMWANDDEGVYWDLMRAIAHNFLRKKPLGSYILIGKARGGKSSFIGLLQTIFSLNNSSQVQLSQLGDPHHTHSLFHSLINAPDEEEEVRVEATGVFKTLSDHGIVTLPVMFSNHPVVLKCDFMSYFPMNHAPEWTGTGAEACVKRSLILPFYNDLSAYDTSMTNFAASTFTADFMVDFMGEIFALATYINRHGFEFSVTMDSEKQAMEEEVDSCNRYQAIFEKFFDGFSSYKELYQDYMLWCKANDFRIRSLKELKFTFRAYNTHRKPYTKTSGVRVSMYRIPQAGHIMFYSEQVVKDLKQPISYFQENNVSVIQGLVQFYEQQGVTL